MVVGIFKTRMSPTVASLISIDTLGASVDNTGIC